jgi:superfamily II RNA helicase
MLSAGIGMHHAGLPKGYRWDFLFFSVDSQVREYVEAKFREKRLSFIFGTTSLALGINMPCKTIVLRYVILSIDRLDFGLKFRCGSSPFFTPLNFHQMSGRAGRRGFDASGNVIFFGVSPKKILKLFRTELPPLKGSFSLSVSFVLRCFMYYSTSKGDEKRKVVVSD